MMKYLRKKQLNQVQNQAQEGRSMVEMLGVLAIVGVLSIGGIEGYRWAMDRYAANQIIHELNVNSAQLAMILQQHPTKKVTLSLGGTYDEEEPHLATIGYPFDYGCDDIFGPISPECTDVGAESYFMTVYKMNERVCRMVSEDVTRVSYYDALEVYNEDADEDLCESGSANNITVLFNINNTPGSGNGEGEEGEEGAVTSHHPATTVSGDDGDLSIPANCKKKGYVYVGGTGGFSNVVGRGIGCCNKVALSPAKGTNVLSGEEEDICSLACENYNTESCCPYIWTGTVCCQVINDGAAGIDAEGNITEACSWGPSGCDGKGGSLSAQKPTHICCAHVFEDGEQATWTGGSDGECCIGGKNVSRGSFTEACCAEIGQSYVNGQCGKVSCDEILDENGSPKISGIDSARLYQCCIEKYGPTAMFDPNAGTNGEGKCCRGAECHPTSTPWSTIITFTPGDISTIITPTPTARTTPSTTLAPSSTTVTPSTAPTTASTPTTMPTTTPLPATPTPQTVPAETTTTLTTPGLATMPESTSAAPPPTLTPVTRPESTSAAPGPTATKTVKSTSATPPPLLTPVTRPESTSQVSDIKPAPGITSKPQCEPWEMWDGQECICAPGFFGDECQQLVY